jgi:NAD(P)-dependent dehydrogenase (short-subunit alcohol dehydrogenase family)
VVSLLYATVGRTPGQRVVPPVEFASSLRRSGLALCALGSWARQRRAVARRERRLRGESALPGELDDKIVLVTGAARRLGRAIAFRLADEGCRIALHYHRSESDAADTLAELRQRGATAFAFPADLSTGGGIRDLFESVDRAFGSLDFLVNSAAILDPLNLLEVGEDDWRRTIDLNLKGAFFCLQQAARRMQPRGGAIVNISDVAALRPWKRYPVHSISKAGIEMLTRVAALALAPKIRVNAVAPGLALKPETMTDERWGTMADAVPLRRAGLPSEIGEAIVFLFENEYVTGETLIVDGGYHLV